MANHPKSKLKILYLRQILEQETDADHGLTMPQLINRLNDLDIPAERKAIYRDIDTLREFGMDIQTLPRYPVEYALVHRGFTLPQLMLLMDTVESCAFLTPQQSRTITANLKLLASDHQRQQLDRRIHVSERATTSGNGVFEAIDTLHEAMRLGRKAQFTYHRIGASGKRQPTRGGKPHVVTPVGIAYADSNYYLTAWSDDHDNFAEFRIDRMGAIHVTNQPATRNEAIRSHSFAEEEYRSFGRFAGQPVTVTLLVEEGKAEIIFDRFGKAAQLFPQPDGSAKAVVKVQKSPQFFGWLAGLGGAVRIEAPSSLREEYFAYLKGLIEQ